MSDTITIVGTVGTDPEKKTPNGVPITTFRVASTERRFDRATGAWIDGETNWYTVSAYRRLAEHAFESLRKTRPRDPDRTAPRAQLGHRREAGHGGRRRCRRDRSRPALRHDGLHAATSAARPQLDAPGDDAGRPPRPVPAPATRRGRAWLRMAPMRMASRRKGPSGSARQSTAAARPRGSGDAVLRAARRVLGVARLDSDRVPPPRASSRAPARPRSSRAGNHGIAAAGGLRRLPSPAEIPAVVERRRVGDRRAVPTPSTSPAASTRSSPAERPRRTSRCSRAVTAAVWATPDQVSGRAYIDALVAAGFDKSAMQVTPDQSTVGNPAESIQFSVRWGEECLVGQVGPSTGAPVDRRRAGPRRGHVPGRPDASDRLVSTAPRPTPRRRGDVDRPVDWTGYG